MRVIASSTLWKFVRFRIPVGERDVVAEHLKRWLFVTERAVWKNAVELKEDFGSASIVTAERVVFNVRGNHFRLVTAVNFQAGLVLVKWLGTHEEYNRIDVKTVDYDRGRYEH